MQLQELCEKERERRLAVEEKSKRAVTEWFRKKDRELKGIFLRQTKMFIFLSRKFLRNFESLDSLPLESFFLSPSRATVERGTVHVI